VVLGVGVEGDVIVFSSQLTDTAGVGVDGGAEFVFASTGRSWSREAKLLPAAPQQNGFFGLNSVAISGNTAVVGEQAADTAAGADAGEVTVFVRLAPGNWTREATLTANDAAGGDKFWGGAGVSGGTRLVDAPRVDTAADRA